MTYREDAPWPSYADFLALPLRERILQVRTMLGLNQDEFAAAVGSRSGRHAVVQWEKHGREPQSGPDR